MSVTRYRIHLALALILAFGGFAAVVATGTAPLLGLDLEGGTSIILRATGEGSTNEAVLDKTVEIIRDRIDRLGALEPEVTRAGESNILIQLPGVEDEEQALRIIGSTAQLTFRQVKEIIGPEAKERPPITREKGSAANTEEVVYPSGLEGEDGAGDPQDAVLYRLEPARLTGDAVASAEATPAGQGSTNWVVLIEMNDVGADTWAEFTSELACLRDEGKQLQSQVAIVLDGRVESVAGMQQPGADPQGGGVECGTGIEGGQTQIDIGDQEEAKELALVLQTGALPVTLEQDEVRKVSPTLGRDSLNAGVLAGLVGLGLVMIYMVAYYRALGLVVWLGLLVFSAVNYTFLSLMGAAGGLSLSLAGVAGMIVSVGVTADSYIVAFERLKDEAQAGKSLRAAVDKGMHRAFRTILVADFVTGAAAIILFFLAVGPVRGFALTLGIATLIDVLVAYFFTRPTVILLARTKFFAEGRFIGIRRALGMAT